MQAFNDDMPYDRFVKLQIAADLIEKDEATPRQASAGARLLRPRRPVLRDIAAQRKLATADELDDRIDTLTRGFLGLTVSCARCHDHKFDPIPQIDYYSLAGVFSSCKLADIPVAPKEEVDKFNAQQERIKKAQGEVLAVYKAERQKLAEKRVARRRRSILSPRGNTEQQKSVEPQAACQRISPRSNKLEPIAFERWIKGQKTDNVFGDLDKIPCPRRRPS